MTEGPADTGLDRRRPRRSLLWVTGALVLAAGGGLAYWQVTGDGDAAAAGNDSGPVATATVTRETLAATETFDGTLGHGDPVTISAAATTDATTDAAGGTVTRIVDAGTKVGRGTELYRVDEQPVVALVGKVPMYRDLASGDTGPDVRQLERNLRELGYDGFTVDDEYTSYTAAAVEDWQEDRGLDETGTVSLSDAVFVPSTGRVDSVHLAVGDPVASGTAVLDIAGSEDVVSLEVDVTDRDLVAPGTVVTVGMADGAEVRGTVTRADVVATASADATGADTSAEDESVTEVEVTLGKAVDEGLSGSSVDVIVEVETRRGVLAVPVNALLALSEGGYGLEVVADDGTTSIVSVETGLFADGKVEVSGADIGAGTMVGVAGR